MVRQIVSVVIGFALWSMVWLAYNALLVMLEVLPHDQNQPFRDAGPLVALIAGSMIATLAAGYTTAVISRSASGRPVAGLGLLLLAVGTLVQLQYWALMPLWYHLTFLSLLLPATIAGGALRKLRGLNS